MANQATAQRLMSRIDHLERETARAKARVARLVNAEAAGGTIAAPIGPIRNRRISRAALLKAAAAGAGGVALAAFGRPLQAEAAYFLQGDSANPGYLQTSIQAYAGFQAGVAVFRGDANPGANSGVAIDGLQGQGSGTASGCWGVGGPNGGNGVTGLGSGAGVRGDGQGLASPGVVGNGSGAGPGVRATGGSTSTFVSGNGPGVSAHGGLPNGDGVDGFGQGTGVGGYFVGGRAQIQLIPAGTAGPPTGFHSSGDVWLDSRRAVWICTADGTPGTFMPLQTGNGNGTGGLGNALSTAVSTQQYSLANSDGVTWQNVDATNLSLNILPSFNSRAVLSANAALWTANPGYNQDVGIFVTGGVYPTKAGQPEAWTESGGFAGTFSPNAAHLETVVPLAAGTSYIVNVVWKTNRPATGATIFAGAGPIGTSFSPTRLTANLVMSP
jgi:hypothetical protein